MPLNNRGSAANGVAGAADAAGPRRGPDRRLRPARRPGPARPPVPQGPTGDEGLLDPGTLRDLAQTYLEIQRDRWPELARRGLLPKATPKAAERLGAEFEERFRDGEVSAAGRLLSDPPWAELGAAYLRFSDDHSTPRSLAQQFRNVLTRAAADGLFVPWEYVFADAAVTGTVAARRGYQACKGLLRRKEAGLGRLYIDEVGRASRDAVEPSAWTGWSTCSACGWSGRATTSTRPTRLPSSSCTSTRCSRNGSSTSSGARSAAAWRTPSGGGRPVLREAPDRKSLPSRQICNAGSSTSPGFRSRWNDSRKLSSARDSV